jgi:outer membrane receptor protein involved in Fe transport
MNRSIRAALAAFAVTTLGLAPRAPHAQESAASGGLEEVVVTARKRAENLVDVPLAISAFDADYLEDTGLSRVDDLAQHTPGLSFRPAFGRVGSGQGGGSSNRPTLRGQSNITGLPNMGFFVDGVFVSGNITSYQLDNLERVEVIRGPQSALFGRGTFAGAVNFITRRPGDELGGKLEATVGDHDHFELSGYVNGPIADGRLAFELSGRYYDFGGDWVNRATGEENGGEESSRNVGAKLFWMPNDDFELELNLGWSLDEDGMFAARYSGVNCLPPTLVATTPLPRSSTRARGYFCGETSTLDSFYARYDLLEAWGLHGVNRETYRSSLKASYDFAEGWTASGIGAYNQFRNQQGFDSGLELGEATGRPAGLNATQDRREDWSLEFRVESPVENRLHGLAGAYYYREDDGRGFNGVFTLPMTGPVPIGSQLVNFSPTLTQDDSAVQNWSLFGLLEFEVSDRLSLTAEGRYQVDKIIRDLAITNPSNALLEEEFSEFLPRFTGLYRMNDQWNLYANVARGNKPGGFNPIPADANAASILFIQQNFQTYDEESAWTYELGLKGGNESRTVQASAALYWIDWTKQQLTQTYIYNRNPPATPTNTSTALVNAGETRIRGLEIDLTARPIDSLELRLAYAYVDSEILDFVDPETEDIYDTDGRVGSFDLAGDPSGQVAGAQLPQSPKHQVIGSGTFTLPVGDTWSAFIRTDMTYESKRYDQVHNLAHTGDSFIVNLRLGAETERWSVTLFANNLTDDDTPASLTRLINATRPVVIPTRQNPALTQTSFYRDIFISYPRKRQIGLTASFKF